MSKSIEQKIKDTISVVIMDLTIMDEVVEEKTEEIYDSIIYNLKNMNNKTIERTLNFEKDMIIHEDIVKHVKSVFKELNESFKQIKDYDEYHYTTTKVSLSISQIDKLNELYYTTIIDSEYILITY